MKTIAKLRLLTCAISSICLCDSYAQVTIANNNPPLGSFVGHSNLNGKPVEVRHDGNFPIEWYTDAIQRMGLNPTQNSTINGFTVPTDGFLGLGLLPVPGTAPGTPWSRLHLHDATSGAGFVALGFRDWMRNGVTFTGHGDQMFVGHKYGPGPTDGTDAIFQWADNSSELLGPDLMRFIFTSDFTNAIYGENSLFGREIMQLHPRGFVGIGDWNEASVVAGSTVAIGAFSVNRDGYPLISSQPDAFINVTSNAPFTRLHLIDQQTGFLVPLV
jgi:hypothetical protein